MTSIHIPYEEQDLLHAHGCIMGLGWFKEEAACRHCQTSATGF
jgi:hypothetical protein